MADKELKVRVGVDMDGDTTPVHDLADGLDAVDEAGKKAGEGLNDAGEGAKRAEKDLDRAADGLKRSGKEAKSAGKGFRGFATTAKAGLAGIKASVLGLLATLGPVVLFFKAFQVVSGIFRDGAEAAREQADAASQVEASLKSTEGQAGLTAGELRQMAEAFDEVTRFSIGTIQSGQAILLGFTQIGREVFPEATQAALDMSAKLKTDLQASVLQLGKALQDPIRGVSALAEVGVSFTEGQRETIRTLVESGQVMEAQKLILAELRVEFGGSAEAARNNFGGAIDGTTKAVSNLVAKIFDGLGPALERLFNLFTDTAGGGNALAEDLGHLAGAAVDFVTLGIITLREQAEIGINLARWTKAQVLEVGGELLAELGELLSHLPFADQLADELRIWGASIQRDAVGKMAKAKTDMIEDLGQLQDGFVVHGTAIVEALEKVGGSAGETGEEVKKGLAPAGDALKELSKGARDLLSGFGLAADEVVDRADKFARQLAEVLDIKGDEVPLKRLREQAREQIDALVDDLRAAGAEIPDSLQAVLDRLGILPEEAGKAAKETRDAVKRYLSEIPGVVADSSEELEKEGKKLRAALLALQTEKPIRLLPPETREQLREDLAAYVAAVQAAGDKVDPIIAAAAQDVGVLGVQWAAAGDAAHAGAARTEEAAGRIVKSVNEAGETVFTMGEKARDAGDALKLDGADEGVDRLAKAAEAGREAGEGFDAAAKGAEAAGERMRTPAELLSEVKDKVAELKGEEKAAADAQRDAASAADTQAEALGRLADQVERIQGADLAGLLAQLDAIWANLNTGTAGAISNLSALKTEAFEVRQALANMDAGDAGEGAA